LGNVRGENSGLSVFATDSINPSRQCAKRSGFAVQQQPPRSERIYAPLSERQAADLGPARPKLLDGTNGVLHASTGLQLNWTVPSVQIPVRACYALNVMRLNRVASLPDGTLFHAHDHLGAFGWALGALF
jgi:hypothetical protein